MIDFDIERFVRKYMTKRPESLLAADFAKFADEMHARIDGKRMLVVGGAGTIGSNYVKAALKGFRPAAMYVVDIDENQLTELTRELRSGSEYTVPAEYVTEPIDLGSKLFDKFFKAHGPFDIVANFAARKHVRAERDVHSIEAMCDTNVFMAKKLLDLLLENSPEAFFCVSTDKAANPVNVMGATKKLMEETIMAYADRLPIKTARFANVAFSNGSLPIGWLNRIAKKQPLSCPLGIRRFFVSPVESGELCLAAASGILLEKTFLYGLVVLRLRFSKSLWSRVSLKSLQSGFNCFFNFYVMLGTLFCLSSGLLGRFDNRHFFPIYIKN